MLNLKKIIVSGDITRIYELGGQMYANGANTNIHRLYHLFRHQLEKASGLPVEVFPQKITDSIFTDLYSALGIQAPLSCNSWHAAYHAIPSEKSLAMIAQIYANSFVIGYELSPFMKKAFASLSIPYIDIIMHPVRFYNDLILGFSSEIDTIMNVLQKKAVSSLSFKMEAGYQQARYIPNIMWATIPENTLMIVGQKSKDKVLLKKNGSIYSLLEFTEQLDQLIDQHDCTYFKPHPRGSDHTILNFFSKHKKVTILPNPTVPYLNTYAYLAHPSIKTIVGLNSSMLVEAYYFGKNTLNLAPFEFNFFYDEPSSFLCEDLVSYPIAKENFSSVGFWHELFSCVKQAPSPSNGETYDTCPLPNLRLIFRGGGGNSFDDAQSYTQCCKIGDIEKQLLTLQQTQDYFDSNNTGGLPIHSPVPPKNKRIENALLHIGCGKKHIQGYIGCDIRPTQSTRVICPAWDVHHYFIDAQEIYSRHMLEHLTYPLVEKTLQSWHTALQPNGMVRIEVPNLEKALTQWDEVKWTAEEWRSPYSKTKHTMATLWGWQTDQTSQTGQHTADLSFWDVHKSGFTQESLGFFLRAAGFTDISFTTSPFGVRAYKRMASGERQISMHLRDIRADHRGRYRYASTFLRPGMKVWDAACGVGYGSFLLTQAVPKLGITAVDIDPYAIQYAKEFYGKNSINYIQSDILDCSFKSKFDAITSFETFEHVLNDELLLSRFFFFFKPGGILFISTPNQETLPFSSNNYPFHVRHYSPSEFTSSLEKAGFIIEQCVSQPSKTDERIVYNTAGLYLLAVCRKP